MIHAGETPFCIVCLAKLTDKEREYYEYRCERCDVDAMLKRARLILTADDSGKLVCLIQKQPGDVAGHFGIALADCARHVAKAFNVDEDEVFAWIEKERLKPSSKLEGGSVQ